MKIRNGFVSNSSSSSFVICLPSKPASVEELHDWMFPNGNEHVSAYGDVYPSEKIAAQVFKDLKEPLASSDIADVLTSGHGFFDGFPKYPKYAYDMSVDAYDKLMNEFDKELKLAAEKYAAKLISENQGVLFDIEYSDDDGGFFTTMEHGNIFRHITHVRVSHH